jgi:hypothetical protein
VGLVLPIRSVINYMAQTPVSGSIPEMSFSFSPGHFIEHLRGTNLATSGAPISPPPGLHGVRQSPPDAGKLPALLIPCSVLPHTSSRRPATLMSLMLPWYEMVGAILPFVDRVLIYSIDGIVNLVSPFQLNRLNRTH